MSDIAESPISRTGNREWDDTFNKCFYDNMSTVVWAHSCMFEGAIFIGKGEECSWCGATEEHEPDVTYSQIPVIMSGMKKGK